MSLGNIPSSTGSSSLSLKRLFSKGSCFESDADYETSSEGQLYPAPETRPSLYKTRESGTMVNNDISIATEVSTELRLEVVGNTKNNEDSGKAEETVQPEVENEVDPISKTDQLVSLVLEPIFSSGLSESCGLFLSDSRQTLESVEPKSNLVLTAGQNSTTDLQSVYREKNSHSIESDSVCKFEQNRIRFIEQDERPKSADKNVDLLKNVEAPIAIEANTESPPNLIQLKNEKPNGSYELKKKLIMKAQIMSQIDNGFAPLRDEMNKIFDQLRDLKEMAFDFDTDYTNLLGISNTVRSTSFLPSLHNAFSAEYKLGSNSYRNTNNYISKTFRPSQERLWFNENLSHPISCENHYCFHKKMSPSFHFENCPHDYLNNRVVPSENTHLQESFVSNSLCNFHGHRVPHVADNSRHISLSDFPIVHQNLHSFHANVLPVNSENLHRHCRSTIPTAVETSDSKVHTACKTVSIRRSNCFADDGKQARISHSVHQNFESKKKVSQENVSKPEKSCKKLNSRESPRNRTKHFSGRRRCKRHCSNLHRQVDHKVLSADNSMYNRNPSKLMNISMDLENLPLSKNCDTSKETLSCLGGLSQLITELTLITKEFVHIEKSGKQLKPDVEFVEVPSSHSGNTIKTEIKCSRKYSNDKEELELSNNCIKPSDEKVVATESLFQQKTFDPARKKSSSVFSYCSHISRPHTEFERPVQSLEHNYHDKACNTENIGEEEYRKRDLINFETRRLEKSVLSTTKDIMKKSLTEIIKTGVSKKDSRKSICNQHLKMSIPKTHEKITIVPIIFSSGMPEPPNENFDFTSSQRSENNDKKRIALNPDSEGRSESDSDFSLSTQAESLATEITHLAKKCAFIRDSRNSINGGMILNSRSSSYSLTKPLGRPTKIEINKKARNELKTIETSSRSSMSYQASLNPVRNSVSVRRIRGIRTSPEDFMYE